MSFSIHPWRFDADTLIYIAPNGISILISLMNQHFSFSKVDIVHLWWFFSKIYPSMSTPRWFAHRNHTLLPSVSRFSCVIWWDPDMLELVKIEIILHFVVHIRYGTSVFLPNRQKHSYIRCMDFLYLRGTRGYSLVGSNYLNIFFCSNLTRIHCTASARKKSSFESTTLWKIGCSQKFET